jgi:hypothetical protein
VEAHAETIEASPMTASVPTLDMLFLLSADPEPRVHGSCFACFFAMIGAKPLETILLRPHEA